MSLDFVLWVLWYQRRIAVEGRETFEVVDGTETLNNAIDKATWKNKNKVAEMLISTALDIDQLEMIITCDTTKEVWDRHIAIHEPQNSTESIYLLTLQSFEYKYQSNDSIGSVLWR